MAAGTSTTLVVLLLALTVAAAAPTPEQPTNICEGTCGRRIAERESRLPARPFEDPVASVYLPIAKGGTGTRIWDPRLDDLGVYLVPAAASPGEAYWRLVEARWADPGESGGRHSIFIDVLDAQGERAMGQQVRVGWSNGSVNLTIDKPLSEEWGTNFAMYSTLGSYDVLVLDLPSDRIHGLGLGTADEPDVTHHTSFYLIYRQVVK
jgi:hypothetical protein